MVAGKVYHTARIEASDRTVLAVEAARAHAGAPVRAKFKFVGFGPAFLEGQIVIGDEPAPVDVEFSWVEHL